MRKIFYRRVLLLMKSLDTLASTCKSCHAWLITRTFLSLNLSVSGCHNWCTRGSSSFSQSISIGKPSWRVCIAISDFCTSFEGRKCIQRFITSMIIFIWVGNFLSCLSGTYNEQWIHFAIYKKKYKFSLPSTLGSEWFSFISSGSSVFSTFVSDSISSISSLIFSSIFFAL